MRSLVTAGLLIATPTVVSITDHSSTAQEQQVPGNPVEVTSDTREYCLHLLDRVSDLVRRSSSPVPSEVMTLSSDGERMCDHGQPKGGILRLRHALMIIEHGGRAYR